MSSFQPSDELAKLATNVTPSLAGKYRTVDTYLIDNMLGDHESRLQRMLRNIQKKETQTTRRNIKQRSRQEVLTIDDGLRQAKLVLPRLSKEPKPIRRSIDSSINLEHLRESEELRLYGVYGQPHQRRSPVVNVKHILPSQSAKQSITPHINPNRRFNSSPKPTSEQQLTNSLDLYYLELQERMGDNLTIPEVLHQQGQLRQLKNRYSHMKHFDKQYYLAHSKLDLALVRDRSG